MLFYVIISWRSVKPALNHSYFIAHNHCAKPACQNVLKWNVIKHNWLTYQRHVNIIFPFHKVKSFTSPLWTCEDELLIQRCHKAHSDVCAVCARSVCVCVCHMWCSLKHHLLTCPPLPQTTHISVHLSFPSLLRHSQRHFIYILFLVFFY